MAKATREQKEKIVKDLKEKLAKASAVILTDYHGLSVSAMQELKKVLREAKAEFNVVKNTLLNLASKNSSLDLPKNVLEGPTALLLSFAEPVEAVKKLTDFLKKYQFPNIKAGFFEGRLLNKEEVINLSKIPSRQELYAKVVGSLNSPIYGLVYTLNGNIRNLVYVLKQIQESKGGAG